MKTRLFLLLLFGSLHGFCQTNNNGSWTQLGPIETFSKANVDPAQKPFPHQTNTFKLESSRSHPNVVYAVVEYRHIYKSLDKGQNWSRVTTNYFLGNATDALVIHPTNPDIVYAAGEDGVIHQTVNGGTTWKVLSSLSGRVFDLKIAPDEPSVLLAGTATGIYRSTNGGTSWGTGPIISNLCYDLEFKPGNPMVVYAVVKSKTSRTTEFRKSTTKGAGFAWKYDAPGAYTDNQDGARIAVTPADPARVYFINLADGLSLFRSNDSGDKFVPGATYASEKALGRDDFCECQGYYDMAINVSPTNADHVIAGTVQALKSTDGGTTFPVAVSREPFPGHSDFQDLWVNGNDAYLVSDGGIVYSTDFFTNPTNAVARNRGIIGQEVLHMDQGWDEDVVVTGVMHNGNVFQSERYNGKTLLLGGHEQGTGWILHGHRRVVTCDAGNMNYPYNFNDPTTEFVYGIQPNHEAVEDKTGEVLIDPRYYNHHYVGFENQLWETWNGGTSFKPIFTANSWVLKAEIGRDNSNVLYVAVQNDAFLQKSVTGGASWETVALPTGWTGLRTDMAINPSNANHLYIVNYNRGNKDKVYVTKDGGAHWDPMETPSDTMLNGWSLFDVRFEAGAKKGVYVTAQKEYKMGNVTGQRMKVFYKDSTMTNWIDFSNGLPKGYLEVKKSRIFFRDAKLRSGSTAGVWETPLYDSNFKPLAQPSVDKKTPVQSILDTFYFYDYSILKYAGATRQWSFSPAPLYVSDATSPRPKVVFGNLGSYAVTLKVTDANGNSNTKTIADMVNISTQFEHGLDSVPGNALVLQNKGYATFPALNKPSTNVTLMAWVKRNGAQDFLAGLLITRSKNENYGLQINDNGSVGYEWHSQFWNTPNDSILPEDTWTHVALVVTPTSGTLYYNGTPVRTNIATHPGIDFENPLFMGSQNKDERFFNGQIDEVAIYQKAMTTKEIREQMHLTKKPAKETTLIAYFQMNEPSGLLYNKVTGYSSTQVGGMMGSTVPSGAPVGGGISFTKTVTTGGLQIFSGPTTYPVGNTGVNVVFPTTGTYPSGDVVVTRLNVGPDRIPTGVRANPQYWIIHNFGSRKQFSTLTSLEITRAGLITSAEQANVSSIKLFSRPFNAVGTSWGLAKDNADFVSGSPSANVTFSIGNGVNSFSKQFIIGIAPTVSNVPPTVSLTSPANNATAIAPASIQLSANATDSDGNIAKVEFFNGNTLLQTVTSAPYTYAWNNVAANTYTITAVATDNLNASTTSGSVTITVTNATSNADILGPDCGTAGASLSFQLNPAVWPNATNINWYYQNAGTITPTNTASVTLKGATPFGPANICVGFRDANGIYQSNKCKYVSTCTGARMEDPLGMESLGMHAKVKVYPNPARNTVYVKMESYDASPLKVTLIDELSRQVLEKNYSLPSGEVIEELDVTGLKSGTYTMVINRGANMLTKRIVILNNSKLFTR